MIINLLAKIAVKGRLVETLHLLLVARTNHHVWHGISPFACIVKRSSNLRFLPGRLFFVFCLPLRSTLFFGGM